MSFFKKYFAYLQTHRLYKSDAPEDRIVFLFVFVSIFRSEIGTYMETWNAHHIRPKKKDPITLQAFPMIFILIYLCLNMDRYRMQNSYLNLKKR